MRASVTAPDTTGPGAWLLQRNAVFLSSSEEKFRTAAILSTTIQTMTLTTLLFIIYLPKYYNLSEDIQQSC